MAFKNFTPMRRHLLIAIIIPLFFVGFALGYRPLEIMSTCDLGHFAPYIHVVLLGCIILCVLLISRAIYFVIEHFTERLKWWEDIIWCVSELLVSALFMAMYMSLFAHTLYFECLATTLQYVFAINVFPYAIITLVEALIYQDESTKYSKDPESTVKFYDEHKNLKLVVSSPSVLYIKADDNSVKINYIESGKIKEFSLRTSMKSLEPIAAKFHFVRCQRSYYVNPAHVSILRKYSEGFIFAILDMDDAKPIPVSKTYYDNIASIL